MYLKLVWGVPHSHMSVIIPAAHPKHLNPGENPGEKDQWMKNLGKYKKGSSSQFKKLDKAII